MVEALFFSDKNVTSRLRERVESAGKLLVVSATRQEKGMRPVEEREPFASIERLLGDKVDQVVCADEGTAEGMWRDPLGSLSDALFPGDSDTAFRAASGYLLLERGVVIGIVKKGDDPSGDLARIWRALWQESDAIPEPPREIRVGQGEVREASFRPRAARVSAPPSDPYRVLGVAPGTAKAEVRKVFRNLLAQYHPDKVAHLAPEFRELAERKSREITAAWQAIDAATR